VSDLEDPQNRVFRTFAGEDGALAPGWAVKQVRISAEDLQRLQQQAGDRLGPIADLPQVRQDLADDVFIMLQDMRCPTVSGQGIQ
jgi:hypothetical protein